MISAIFLKCAILITVIHMLRQLGRRFGPRASGMLLGLPSTTAVLLLLCGHEKGIDAASEMADAGLLGLIAAAALPVGFASALGRGRNLPAAIATAIGAYVFAALGLGYLRPVERVDGLVLAIASIAAATLVVSRVRAPAHGFSRRRRSRRASALIRTVLPTSCLATASVLTSVASPGWSGLIGTFPSISTAFLAVTYLEDGSVAAIRVARVLPPTSLSTAAFLGAFRFAAPRLGLAWGMVFGYCAAFIVLGIIESALVLVRHRTDRRSSLARNVADREVIWDWTARVLRHRAWARPGPSPRSLRGIRTRRRRFAPRLEILLC
ncbi:MAG: hypothetical protein ACYC61_19605 [Isosphaeraceae bacterium]